MNFLDADGVPTERWNLYRSSSSPGKVLAKGIREIYSDLFRLYPDAYRKDDEAIRNFLSSKTAVAQSTISRMVTTFRILCDLADFEGKPDTITTGPVKATAEGRVSEPPLTVTGSKSPAISLNLQITLPATDDPKVYDQFFSAMKKHLFSDES